MEGSHCEACKARVLWCGIDSDITYTDHMSAIPDSSSQPAAETHVWQSPNQNFWVTVCWFFTGRGVSVAYRLVIQCGHDMKTTAVASVMSASLFNHKLTEDTNSLAENLQLSKNVRESQSHGLGCKSEATSLWRSSPQASYSSKIINPWVLVKSTARQAGQVVRSAVSITKSYNYYNYRRRG